MRPRVAPNAHGEAARADKVTGIVVAILMHAAVIFLLLQYSPARTALINAVPLMVSLITPAAPKPDVLPKPLPVKRVPQQARVAPPQPAPAAVPAAASTAIVPPALPAPPLAVALNTHRSLGHAIPEQPIGVRRRRTDCRT